MRTVGDLIKALRPRGYVCALVTFYYTGDDNPVRHTVHVVKTDLMTELKGLDPTRKALFKIEEWNWQTSNGYWRRARRIMLGSDAPDEIQTRFIYYGYQKVFPVGTKPEFEDDSRGSPQGN